MDTTNAAGPRARCRRCSARGPRVVGRRHPLGGVQHGRAADAGAHAGCSPRVDYLSSVSGGGYIASCLTWLRAHVPASSTQKLGAVPLADGTGTVLDWLRAHGRYLITGKGLSGWTLGASILSGTLLNLFVLLPMFLLCIGLASGDWFEFRWPPELQLPGAGAVRAHDGFMVLAIAGVGAARALSTGDAGVRAEHGAAAAAPAQRRAIPPAAARAVARRRRDLHRHRPAARARGHRGDRRDLPARGFRAGDSRATRPGSCRWSPARFSVRQANKQGAHADTFAVVGLALVLAGCSPALYHLAHHTTAADDPGFMVWLARVGAVRVHLRHQRGLDAQLLPQPARRSVPARSAATAHASRDSHPMLFRLADVRADVRRPVPHHQHHAEHHQLDRTRSCARATART